MKDEFGFEIEAGPGLAGVLESQEDSRHESLFGEEEWETAVSCPGPTREIVSGFSRYQTSLMSLPRSEQQKVRDIAGLIVRSFQPGCQPLLSVRLIGHAERDPEMERREPRFVMRISLERALAVKRGLETLINNRTISSRIAWKARGVGSSRLVVPSPRTERERMRNRRVEIFVLQPQVPARPPSSSLTNKKDNIIFGLDTASVAGNKNPNWVQAKAEGPISFAIIRSNYGDWEDPIFKRDWPKMKAAGIVRGAYLFLRFPHPTSGMKAPDPVSQAKAVIKTVRNLDQSDFPPTIDVEFPGDKRHPRRTGREFTGMTAQQLLDGVRAAWEVLKDYYGVAPIIYTSARVWKEELLNLPAPDLVESPLWLAHYVFKGGTSAVRNARAFKGGRLDPHVPPPWGDSTNWWIHQYQGDAVRLPGFPTGNVDMNRFNTMLKGATGDRVKWVQRRLGIAQNGQFDGATDSALRAFQDKKGLVSDGVVGPPTFAYLCWSNP
jgi:GH25 family lysozyme M1 (1,4-beta-N-acetylmuramidase)